MGERIGKDDPLFRDAIAGLQRGDFSRLEPQFVAECGRPQIIQWHEAGLFDDAPKELAEALTCACFLGRVAVAEYLLARGIDPSTGNGTGLDAIHWAANRGQLEAVRLLVRHKAPLETRNMYGGTALGTAVWSAINEPRSGQLQAIEALLMAGARVEEAGYPTGHESLDALLRRFGAK